MNESDAQAPLAAPQSLEATTGRENGARPGESLPGPFSPPSKPRRSGRPALTEAQRVLAESLAERALAIRDGAEEGLSLREAVELAVHQMGLGQ